MTLISTASVELARACTVFNEMAGKLSVRNSQIQLRHKKKHLNPENIMVTTVNGIQVTWDDAVTRLVEVESSAGDRMGPMTFPELQQVARVIQGINVLSLESVAEMHSSAPKAVSDQLLYWFPIVLVDHDKTCLLVNSFEFHIDLINHEPSMNTFADLITPGSQNEISFPEPHNSGPSQLPPVFSDLPSGNVGRPAKHIQFSGIVEVALAFIQQHGYSAQSRRTSDTANSCGVTLAQIRKHLLDNIPGLKEAGISRQTIHNLMVAPRAKTINIKTYKSLLKARVPKKDNSGTFNEHPDRHLCASQVKGAVEFGVKFQDETLFLSSDNMNKVNVGVLAVSRYHQLQHFFPDNDLPVYPDHDFPPMNSKITLSGYLVLEPRNSQKLRHRARSLSPPKRLPESAPRSCRRSQSLGDTPAQQAVGARDKHVGVVVGASLLVIPQLNRQWV